MFYFIFMFIGNLEDIIFWVFCLFKEVDLILVEDICIFKKLLDYYDIIMLFCVYYVYNEYNIIDNLVE